MSKLGRFLLLGAVMIGVVLALSAAPSAGGVRGQTGYGDDVVQPCAPGEDTGPGGEACLKSFETATPAGETGGGSDDGSNTVKYIFIAGMVLVIGGGIAYLISYTEFLSRFRRS